MALKAHSRHTLLRRAALVTGIMAVAASAWGQVLNEDLTLERLAGAPGDSFGATIAIDGGIVAVGASGVENDDGNLVGAAYLFDATTGEQLAILRVSDGRQFDQFGAAIDIDGGIVVVGAPGDDEGWTDSGAAYLFDVDTGAFLAKLLPIEGGRSNWFGHSVAIAGGVVVVGAHGHVDANGNATGVAYLFDAATGVQTAALLASDGGHNHFFGQSVAISADGIVVVGANNDDDLGQSSGSVYLFDASTGTQLAKLLPGDGDSGDRFGFPVAIDDGIVVVASTGDADNGFQSGSVYTFDAATGTQFFKLLPSDGVARDRFGYEIAIDSGVIAIGSSLDDDNGASSGSAYLFDAATGTQISKLLPSNGATLDEFGFAIEIDNGAIAVGAFRADTDHGVDSGAAWVFDITCPVDLNHDDLVNTQDFLAYLNAWAVGDPVANWNIEGTIDTQDFLAYLNDWVAGCP